MRRDVRWDDEHPIEPQRRARRFCNIEVAVMNGIEGAAEDADPPLRRQRRLEGLELLPHDIEIADGIASGRARDVHEVHEHFGPLEMAEELMAEAEAAMRALDQPRHVGDDEAAVLAEADDAQV